MKKIISICLFFIIGLNINAQMTPVLNPPIPSKMSFAGEKIPLENWDVKERLDRELMINAYMQSKTMHIIKLANRYERTIKSILKENNIPEDFYYLAVAESALMNQTSKAGAVGFWQFMPVTATSFNLEVNSNVDERYHVELSTKAACEYLKTAYTKFNSWISAAASYNIGMGGLNSRMTEQGQFSYFDIVLPEETERYVFRILALKLILQNPEFYGYKIPKNELYSIIPTKDVYVNYEIPNLISWAKENNTTYRILKELNPWLREKFLNNNSKKTYIFKIPTRL